VVRSSAASDVYKRQVLNELACTVTEVTRGGSGGWKVEKGVSTLPEGWKGENTCAEILLHPGGKFLYATNRGHNSVARFEIIKGGGLKFLGTTPSGGEIPRNAALSPDGTQLVVANQETGNLVPFSVDSSSGDLKQSGKPVNVAKAVCVLFTETK
jgi:6-phosphogluconolactonase